MYNYGLNGENQMTLSTEEVEITEFYREGVAIATLAEVYGHSVYRIKKLLANEPAIQPSGYIWRSLYGKIPDCQIK